MTKPTKPVTKPIMKPFMKPIPKFASEKQERAYWEKHDSTEHLDWSTFLGRGRLPDHAFAQPRFGEKQLVQVIYEPRPSRLE